MYVKDPGDTRQMEVLVTIVAELLIRQSRSEPHVCERPRRYPPNGSSCHDCSPHVTVSVFKHPVILGPLNLTGCIQEGDGLPRCSESVRSCVGIDVARVMCCKHLTTAIKESLIKLKWGSQAGVASVGILRSYQTQRGDRASPRILKNNGETPRFDHTISGEGESRLTNLAGSIYFATQASTRMGWLKDESMNIKIRMEASTHLIQWGSGLHPQYKHGV
jgi:hypothetical protein